MAVRQADEVAALCQGLQSDTACVKYGAARSLRRISEQAPERVYPCFDLFFELFEGDNTFLRWGATRILGNLAPVDTKKRLDRRLPRFLAPLRGHEMIGAANVLQAAAQIATAKPHLADRIATRVLEVERANYATPECRLVGIGHAIDALARIYPLLKHRRSVLEFVQRQADCPRQATRRKAERFLRRHAVV